MDIVTLSLSLSQKDIVAISRDLSSEETVTISLWLYFFVSLWMHHHCSEVLGFTASVPRGSGLWSPG